MEDKKIIKYIIDTSAIIADPDVIYKLKDNIIYIPIVVVRELDGLKNSDTEWVAQNARKFTRTLDRFSSYADLMEGVKLSSGGILKLYRDYVEINELASDADNKVVGAAMHIRKNHRGRVCVLSTDGNMRVVARSHGLAAEFAPFYIGENEPTSLDERTHAAISTEEVSNNTSEVEPMVFADLKDKEMYEEMKLMGMDPDKKISFMETLWSILTSLIVFRSYKQKRSFLDEWDDDLITGKNHIGNPANVFYPKDHFHQFSDDDT